MARCQDVLLGLTLIGALSGCRSTPIGNVIAQPDGPPPAAPVALAPRTTLAWTVESADPLVQTMSGEGDIGPDGSLEIGPYGTVKVAGQSLESARLAIEHFLTQHIPQPRVGLSLASAQPIRIESTWHNAATLASHSYAPLQPVAASEANETKPEVGLRPEAAMETKVEEPAVEPLPGESPHHQSWQDVDRLGDETGPASQWRPVSRVVPQAMPTITHVQETKPDELKLFPKKLMPDGNGGEAVMSHPVALPVPREQAKVTMPPYIIEPPDILLVESTQQLRDQPIRGQHLVRPDGYIGLGIYGSVFVAGLTLEQAKDAIAQQVAKRVKDVDPRNISVDVLAYNSKFYYVITDGAGYGEQVIRLPITGNETVLDAISQINGLPAVASKKNIWVARSNPYNGGHEQVLPVDWNSIAQRGSTATNYQLMPGDRVYVRAQKIIRADTVIAKILSPFERILGVTLLGATTVNEISGRGITGTGR